jgi:hypothetical protein
MMASGSVLARAFAPVDVAPLVYARIVFGALMVVEIGRFFWYGWIHLYYVRPTFFFAYPGFDWVKPMPAEGMYALFVALAALAGLIALGLYHRAAAALFGVGFSYVFLLDQTNYMNHLYLICLLALLLAFVPAGAGGSLDAVRTGRAEQTAPAWTLWLLRGQIAVVYFFGGIAKIDGDWLGGAPAGVFLDNWELTDPLSGSHVGRRAFAIGGLLFDLLVVPALLWRRTRWLASGAAAAFHLTNFKLFSIGIFPWLMLALIPLFWPASGARRILACVAILPATWPTSAATVVPRRARSVVAALVAYAAFQILVPLRHWLYPGDVNWTEEGHNFSWHMKLRVKEGRTLFRVVDLRTGEQWVVDPRHRLTPRQVSKMATRPEMIRQFARELSRRLRAEGREDVAIHALAQARLNAWPRQALVNPDVDLGRMERSLGAASWIVPLGSGGVKRAPSPPRLR